ncbi:MAG: hypothetical protein IPL40_12775 [Proteobacteria bacterium]|nr:hypothetical protein [Pseudomonadota bacterium]
MRGSRRVGRAVGVTAALLLVAAGSLSCSRADGAPVDGVASQWPDDEPLTKVLEATRLRGGRLLVLLVEDEWQRCATLARWRRAGARLATTVGRFDRLLYRADSREGAHVAERFHVVSRPTVLILDGAAQELGRVGPPLAAATLLLELEGVEDGTSAEHALEGQLSATPGDLSLQLRAAALWAQRGAFTRATPLLEVALAADPDDAQGWASQALLLRGDLLLLRGLHDATGALRWLSELRRRFPRAAAAHRAGYPLARALHRLGRRQEARALLDGWAKSAVEHHQAARLVLDEPGCPAPWALRHARRALALDAQQARYWARLAAVQRLARDAAGARASEARAFALSGCGAQVRGSLQPGH